MDHFLGHLISGEAQGPTRVTLRNHALKPWVLQKISPPHLEIFKVQGVISLVGQIKDV